MNNRLLHAQNIVPVHPVEYILPENLDALPELPMTDNGDGTYYCDGVSTQETTQGTNLTGELIPGLLNDNQGTIQVIPSSYVGTYRSIWIELEAGTYTLSSSYYIHLVRRVMEEKHELISVSVPANNNYTFTLAKKGYFGLTFRRGDNANWSSETIMLNTGNTALPYEPYTGGRSSPNPDYPQEIVNTYRAGTYKTVCGDKTYKVTLQDDLRSVGDTADRLWIDTRKWECSVDRKIATKSFDGTINKTWYDYGASAAANTRTYTAKFDSTKKSFQSSLCTHFENVNRCWGGKICGQYSDHEINDNKYFVSDKLTLEEWGQYLSDQYSEGTPVTVQHMLQAPVKNKMDLTEVKAVNAGSGIEGTVNDTVDVLKVYGKSSQEQSTAGTNLADIELEYGNISVTDGKDIASDVGLRNIGYIDVKPGEQYTLSICTTRTQLLQFGIRFYNADAVFTASISSPAAVAKDGIYSSTFQVPESASKMRFVFTSIESNKIAWLNLGTIAKDYEPFTVDSPSTAYPQPIKNVEGKVHSHGYNLFDKRLWNIGKGTSCAGAGFSYQIVSGKFAVATIALEPGQKYTFTINNNQYWLNRIIEANEDGICTVNHDFYRDISNSKDRYTWTTNSNTTHAVFSFRLTNESAVTQDDVDIVKFMLIEGDKKKPFVRFRGSTITLPVLRSLPDGTRDVLTIDRAQKRAQVERKVGMNTVNTALWADWETGKRVILSAPGIKTPQYIGDCIGFCNIAKGIKNLNLKGFSTIKPYKAIYWYPDAADFGLTGNETMAEANAVLQAFLQQTPFECTYALAEPITEEIPWTDDLLLLTNQYHTSITADSELDPDIEVQAKILGNR